MLFTHHTPARLAALFVVSGLAAAQARHSWWDRAPEQKAGPYWIKTDLSASDANRLAAHLAFMHGHYSARLAAAPPRAPAPMNVMVFAHRDEYLGTLELRFGVDGAGTGGMFFATPSGSALALWTEGLTRQRVLHVVQHEGFHQFAYTRFGSDLPMWVNEGFAEYFGEAVPMGHALLAGQLTPRTIQSVHDAIELQRAVPFERMMQMDGHDWTDAVRDGDAAALYHQARTMVQFLIEGDDGRYTTAFETWLKLMAAAYPADHAFKRAFKTDDVASFEERWRVWVLDARPGAFVTALERIQFLAQGALHLHERGVTPTSLESLQAALSEAGFRWRQRSHDVEYELDAADERLYTIPRDALCEADPIFEVRRPEPRPGDRPHDPPGIRTMHLGPRDITVRWVRDGDQLRYELEW